MSKIIKAAELKILIPNDEQTVIPAPKIKADASPALDGTILEGSNLMKDARKKAASIITEAEEKAQLILKEAQRQAEALHLRAKEEGYAEGHSEGLQAGKEEALTAASDLIEVLEETVNEAVQLRTSALAALEDDFLKLSLLLADKIVRKKVKDDRSWLQPIIAEALSALGSISEIIVRLNPVDYALVQEQQENFMPKTRVKIHFESDPSISQGGCLLESETGLIDASLEKRLGKTAKYLLEVLYDEKS